MRQAANGDDVSVHYTGWLTGGAEFDSSRGGAPLEVSIGENGVIEPFEKALVGMTVGQIKRVTAPPEDAYGPRQEALVHTVSRTQLPPSLDLRPGLELEAQGEAGQTLRFRVVGFDDDRAVLDANHPLAGQTLTFEIEMVDIRPGDDE